MSEVNIMVDLETLGRAAGCKIMAIGAVVFDVTPGTLGSEFYCKVNRGGQPGLTEDPETIAWWSQQSEEARAAALDAPGIPLLQALTEFTAWVHSLGGDAIIWGNGANFDNPILSAAYTACGQRQPWKFWNDRCYRTLKNLVPTVALERQGTYHHALDDAKSQAEHAIRILTWLPYLNEHIKAVEAHKDGRDIID